MKVLIIGGGIGGYVCAIRAAQLGMEVTLAERENIGGTCLNEGCIPTKALLESADYLVKAREAKDYGIAVDEPSFNYSDIAKRKDKIIKGLVGGVRGLIRKNKINLVNGEAKIIDGKTALVKDQEETFDAIVLATGSKPVVLPIEGMDLDGVIDSTEALDLQELPETMVIIGGGVIGVEFASLYESFGVKVTIVEMMDRIVPPLDKDISEALKLSLTEKGIEIFTSAKVLRIEKKDRLDVTFEMDGKEEVATGDLVLVATGRRPITDALEGAKVEVEMNRRFIAIDDNYRTNIDGLYAIGDCTGKSMLAHSAEEMGLRCAELLAGQKPRRLDYHKIPSCLYTSPEAASVGLTQDQAEEQGYPTVAGVFPLLANSRALIVGQGKGTFVKIVADEETKEVLGVHIFGPYATEIIAEASLALGLECTVNELAETVHPHPTVSEGIKEAAASLLDGAIHF